MQLLLAEAEVGRRGIEAAEHLVVLETARRLEPKPKSGTSSGLDSLLHLVALSRGDPAGRDGRVDPLLEGALDRRRELAGTDAELAVAASLRTAWLSCLGESWVAAIAAPPPATARRAAAPAATLRFIRFSIRCSFRSRVLG